jgi:hypothetical protein
MIRLTPPNDRGFAAGLLAGRLEPLRSMPNGTTGNG